MPLIGQPNSPASPHFILIGNKSVACNASKLQWSGHELRPLTTFQSLATALVIPLLRRCHNFATGELANTSTYECRWHKKPLKARFNLITPFHLSAPLNTTKNLSYVV